MANETVYGFIGLEHLFSTRVDASNVNIVYDAVRETLTEYNRIIAGLMSNFVSQTTVAQEQLQQPGAGTMQPLDDFGNPLPVLPGPSYQVGYPIQGAGTAWGNNRVTRALMTVEEVNNSVADALRRDRDWLLRHFIASVLDSSSWTFADKVGPNGMKGLGDISIQPLANGDAVTYVSRGGVVATDSHYLFQAAVIADATNPFPVIRQELIEHPGNSGPLVAYVASNLLTAITGLAEFVEVSDPDITYGTGESKVFAGTPAILGPGVEVIGKTKSSNCWIAEWPNLPDDYIIAGMIGTPAPVRLREYPAASLQGLFTEFHSDDGNVEANRYIRYAGFGVADRTGMLAMQIENASYTVPTASNAPLPI